MRPVALDFCREMVYDKGDKNRLERKSFDMASKKTKLVANALIYALIYILLGILFCIFRGRVAVWCVYVIGALLIVQGVLDMVHQRLIQGRRPPQRP